MSFLKDMKVVSFKGRSKEEKFKLNSDLFSQKIIYHNLITITDILSPDPYPIAVFIKVLDMSSGSS